MEPRILLSADAAGFVTSDPFQAQEPPAEFVLDDNLEPLPAEQVGQHEAQRLELVFVDANAPDAEELVASLREQAEDRRDLEVILLDGNRDGVWQITQALQNYSDVSAIHIISHGSDGAVSLGNTLVDSESLDIQRDQYLAWANSLNADADSLFYGCELV